MGSMRRRRPCRGFMVGTSSERAAFFLDEDCCKLCVVSFEVGGMPKKSKAPNDCLPQNGMNVENLLIESFPRCVWLASKLEECPKTRKAPNDCLPQNGMNTEGENLPIELLDVFSKKYTEPMNDLVGTERHLLKEMDFICHVEHPHKFISN